jgi:hypothetical protein
MSIATDTKVEMLLKTCESLVETGNLMREGVQLLNERQQELLKRVADLENELEMIKSAPALITDVPRGTNTNGRPQKR